MLVMYFIDTLSQEHLDYDILRSSDPELRKVTIRINIYKQRRQTIQVRIYAQL